MTAAEGDTASRPRARCEPTQGLPPRDRRLALPDEQALAALAQRLAAALPTGALLVLTGPLGAGKTTFVRHLARALGSEAVVTSPTYALVHEYPTPEGTLVHVDAYRLPDAAALVALGLDELRDRARLMVVEWGEVLLGRDADAYHLELDRAGDVDGERRDRDTGDRDTGARVESDVSDVSDAALHGATWRGRPGR